jgi:hypothetical protein
VLTCRYSLLLFALYWVKYIFFLFCFALQILEILINYHSSNHIVLINFIKPVEDIIKICQDSLMIVSIATMSSTWYVSTRINETEYDIMFPFR